MGKKSTIPQWLRQPVSERVSRGETRKAANGLNTVCEEARCPNRGVCFGEQGTATFLIMGPGCSRDCSFCSVESGPKPLDTSEPEKVARAAQSMDLSYVVVTSTTRDDLDDGGASFFADTINHIHRSLPDVPIEVLAPDFRGNENAVDTLINAGIAVFGHNIETVPKLYPYIRKGADYQTSLSVLEYAASKDVITKSALIIGMGENDAEIVRTMRDIRESGVVLLAIGQYLQPTREQTPVARYVTQGEFDYWRDFALDIGFDDCVSGPFVRSSYKAAALYKRYEKRTGE